MTPKHKNKLNKTFLLESILIILTVLVSFRDFISLYTTEYFKVLQDIIVVALFLIIVIKNRKHLKVGKSDIFFIAIIIMSLLTTIFNHCDLLNCIFQLRNIIVIYALYFGLKNLSIKINYKKIIYTFCIITILLTIFSAIEVIFEKRVLFPETWANSIFYADNFRRSYSLLNNPNTYAAFTVLSYILIDSYDKKSRFERILTYIMLGISATSIGLSASRSGIIIFAVYLIYKVIIDIKNKRFAWVTVFKTLTTILLSIALVSIVDLARNTINPTTAKSPEQPILLASITQTPYKALGANANPKNQHNQLIDRLISLFSGDVAQTSVVDGRLQHVEKAIEVFKDHPTFGTGLGTFGSSGSLRNKPSLYDQYDIKEGFYADNEYLVILVETGLIGFALVICFLIYFIKENRKTTNILITIIVLLILGLFYNIIEIFPLMYISIIIISMSRNQAKNLHSNSICSITKE